VGDDIVGAYARDGCAIVRNFVAPQTADEMMESMSVMIEDWDPQSSRHSVFHVNSGEGATAEAGSEAAALARDQYLFTSAGGVGFFLNPGAIDQTTGNVRTDIPKAHLLNKVGHALHVTDPVFRDYAASKQVASLVTQLGYTSPVMPQSMYIFKQPHIGEQVSSHQDATFLNTAPDLTCMGLLLFLEDATLDNGCLWARKGSHKEPLRQRWERNPAWFAAIEAGESVAGIEAMIFADLDDTSESPATGLVESGKLGNDSTPENAAVLRDAGYSALPCNKGDVLLVHGKVDHLSLMNNSPTSRHTFQLHLVEDSPASRWRSSNWQQYDPFPQINVGGA
jgi:phytanoyl-CoA hydroxylase